jgi:heterodisulfide reductase subunit A
VYRDAGQLVVQAADTLDGGQRIDIRADMVVLATAAVPQPDAHAMSQRIGIGHDGDGWLSEAHPKLRPVETNTAGVFLAGACQGPKDIPESVAQASAVAAKVLAMFSAEELSRDPVVAHVNRMPPPIYSTCIGCFTCLSACPYKAIEREELRDRRGNLVKTVARVNSGLCQGCGTCVSLCRSKSIDLDGLTEDQMFAALAALAV